MDEAEVEQYHPRMPNAHNRIEQLVRSDAVVLFMKGTREAPQCGFSATVVGLLDQYLPDYTTINVLADPDIRDGVKTYTNWPTIPQLYVDGEFVGGCDIVRQLDESGTLFSTLGSAVQAPAAPTIQITDAAANIFRQATQGASSDEVLRLTIDSRFRHDLAILRPSPNDIPVTSNGILIYFDWASARRAEGLAIDYVTSPQEGFKMDNPNAPPRVQNIAPQEAKTLLESTASARLVDVRDDDERQIARIEGSTRLDQAALDELLTLPKDTPLVFMCHYGARSLQAATHFIQQGFSRIYNVDGGIDRWAQDIDSSIPRY